MLKISLKDHAPVLNIERLKGCFPYEISDCPSYKT